MNFRFLFWACVLVTSLIGIGLCSRTLALEGLPYSQSLFGRGVVCACLAIALGAKKRLSLIPKFPLSQLFRAAVAGVALSLLTVSYNWLTASTVAIISNADVPLLIALGPLVGIHAGHKVRWLALALTSLLVFFVAQLEPQPHLFYGISTLLTGTILLCFGYVFLKKCLQEENDAIAILTPSLAILFFGLTATIWSGGPRSVVSSHAILQIGISGICMFAAYFATMRLYEISDLAVAEFPTLISSVLIQPLEFWFLKVPMQVSYLLSALCFVLVAFYLLRVQERASA